MATDDGKRRQLQAAHHRRVDQYVLLYDDLQDSLRGDPQAQKELREFVMALTGSTDPSIW